MAKPAPSVMDKIVSLCKRRGFVFPASEIYGGQGSTYDWGPLGVELKKRVKDAWWEAMVYSRQDVVGLDSAIIQSPRVWEASGHVGGFSDPLIDNKTSKQRYRADHLVEAKIEKYRKKGKTEKEKALAGKLAAAMGDNGALKQLILDEGIKDPGLGHRRLDRCAPVQLDVSNAGRCRRGQRERGVSAPGDRAGHLHQLQQCRDRDAQEAAVWHRANREVLPQRNHAGQLRFPHA